ncbi:hypothetical protein M422DRAFT_42621 [Sphaerobolus stellatus SS14]|nr:hypothetical protein M422DRAFT_42621 [Sphaerobolus stellatus SS14]
MKLLKSKEIIHFNSDKYAEEISNEESYTLEMLALNIYKKRRAITSSKTSIATSVVGAAVTGGISLIGTAMSARSISVENRNSPFLKRNERIEVKEPCPNDVLRICSFPLSSLGRWLALLSMLT